MISIKQAIAMRGENPSLDRKSPESSEMELGGIWEDEVEVDINEQGTVQRRQSISCHQARSARLVWQLLVCQ